MASASRNGQWLCVIASNITERTYLDGFFSANAQWKIVCTNHHAAALAGIDHDAAIGEVV